MTVRSVGIPAIGFVLGAGALLFATSSEAAVSVTPLKSAPEIVQVAQGCGPGRWRGPNGWCHGAGYYPGPYYHPYAYGRRCWRGAYGYWHCY
jgi:hypothetical protein